jgi:hypothetical protein
MESHAFAPQIENNKMSVATVGDFSVDEKVHVANNREQRRNTCPDVNRPVRATNRKDTKEPNERRGTTDQQHNGLGLENPDRGPAFPTVIVGMKIDRDTPRNPS